MDKKELQKVISLTFDENPEVRMHAALQLAQSDEPGATFALLELSYDKDEKVKGAARALLSKRQTQEKDSISFADLFGKPSEPELIMPKDSEAEDIKKRKAFQPIERIFEKGLGKTKAAMVRSKMMPTIEKVYKNAVGTGIEDKERREKSMQKMITSYVDIISGLDRIMFEEEKDAPVQEIKEATAPETDDKGGELEEIGSEIDTKKINQELAELESEVMVETAQQKKNEEEPENRDGKNEKSIFRKAYDLMMACDGDEEVMFQQSQKLLKQLNEDVDLAFKMAKQRFKAENITHLTELKDGMRNVNTDVLQVKAVNVGEYARTKTKKDNYTRIVANDGEGSEGVIYLFDGRGKEVQPNMKIKVSRGQVKTFAFSGETAMTISKKGNVYIVL